MLINKEKQKINFNDPAVEIFGNKIEYAQLDAGMSFTEM